MAVSREQYSQSKWLTAREVFGNQTPLYLENLTKFYWAKYLSASKTYYFNYLKVANQKGEKSIKQFVKAMFKEIDLVKPEKLVIDLRLNRGGNYHLSAPLVKAIKARPWLNVTGKVYVVTRRTTFSAATVTAIQLKQQTTALLVGEPSRGKPNGADNYEVFFLPHSNIKVGYTNRLKDHMPEIGDSPTLPVDIAVENTIEDIKQGEDRILKRIIQYQQN